MAHFRRRSFRCAIIMLFRIKAWGPYLEGIKLAAAALVVTRVICSITLAFSCTTLVSLARAAAYPVDVKAGACEPVERKRRCSLTGFDGGKSFAKVADVSASKGIEAMYAPSDSSWRVRKKFSSSPPQPVVSRASVNEHPSPSHLSRTVSRKEPPLIGQHQPCPRLIMTHKKFR